MAENQNPVFTDNSTILGDGTEENPLASASAGGGITEITSVDDSIEITDPTGPTTDLSVNAPTAVADGTLVVSDFGSPGKLKLPSAQYQILNNGAGGARIQAVQNTGGELMLLENTSGGPILNLGAGAGGGSGSGTFVVSQNGSMRSSGPNINFSALQIFADNAAAIAGGLNQWDLYRTGADPDFVCIVH